MESFYLDKYTYYLKIQHNNTINKKEKTVKEKEKNVQLNKCE